MDMPRSEVRKLRFDEYSATKHLEHATKQAHERNYQDFLIVDVDSHHYENESYKEVFSYIDNPVIRRAAMESTKRGGRSSMMNTQVGYQDVSGRIPRYTTRRTEKTPPAPHRDVTLTKRWMDAMGVDMVCLFPTPMLQLGLHPQVEVEVALARAYNRWLIDTILVDEPRFRSMLYLPFNDPEACYRMVKEFGDKKGVVGFMVTSARYKPVNDNAYMKTYALMEEMGLPLSFHAAYNWDDRALGNANRFITAHALGFTVFNMINLANWVVNGLPERFPKLRVAWIESGLAWVPFMMQRFDNEYMMRSSECPSLKGKPSDYIRQMYFTSQPMEMVGNRTMLQETFKMMNAETQLCYASDYPHWDMDLPSTIYDLPFLNDQAKRNILGANAVRFFNIKDPAWCDWKIAARAAKAAAQ